MPMLCVAAIQAKVGGLIGMVMWHAGACQVRQQRVPWLVYLFLPYMKQKTEKNIDDGDHDECE